MNELTYPALIEKLKRYMPNLDTEPIDRAFALADKAHADQMRKGGDPYITHPVAVAHLLADMEMDRESIMAGLLHDVVEDSAITCAEIKEQFGQDVMELVDGVTKLGRIPYSSKEEQQIENLRKMFLAMAKDVRVIIIKLCDRLHNMRTIGSMTPQKQREKALETIEVYSPLAHRLGISKIKSELEDISIKVLDPIGCKEIEDTMLRLVDDNATFLDKVEHDIKQRLEPHGIKCSISGRSKHLYSIYRKVFEQNRSINEIYDLFAVRVIVDSLIDCYNVLGIVHDMYRPIPGRFKDYISTPKPNMYQSLHTTLIDKDRGGIVFEVQIRTWDMHMTAEYGIAAHWKYKSGVTDSSQDEKLTWIRRLLDTQKDTNDPEDFKRALKIDMFTDEVFVFTPKGDVINLPLGSTVIDFAYNIHSAVGNHMTGGKVNGKIVPINYNLKNGDIVEIITSGSSSGPNLDWLKLAKTSEARNKIRQWFKKEKREENIVRGKDMLEKELKRNGMSMSQVMNDSILPVLFKKFHVNAPDELFAGIGYGGISMHNVILRVDNELKRIAKEAKGDIADEIKKQIRKADSDGYKANNGIIIEGVDNVLVKFARCCNPLPGDPVIGFVTKGYGVSVHKRDCVNVIAGLTNPEEASRWIDVKWEKDISSTFVSIVQITARDRLNLLADVVNMISNMHIAMHSLNARESKDGFSVINVTLDISNLEQLNAIIRKLERIEGVIDVVRSMQ